MESDRGRLHGVCFNYFPPTDLFLSSCHGNAGLSVPEEEEEEKVDIPKQPRCLYEWLNHDMNCIKGWLGLYIFLAFCVFVTLAMCRKGSWRSG
jgi:hypothetical protein